jgi:hypothetical protein
MSAPIIVLLLAWVFLLAFTVAPEQPKLLRYTVPWVRLGQRSLQP